MPVLKSLLIILFLFVASTAFGAYPGDCDSNGTVTIAEVQKAVNMNLDPGLADICVDLDEDGTVTQSEVQLVVDAFLGPLSLPVGIVARGAYVVEGDAALKDITLQVQLTKAYDAPVSINWATADGTALAGSDYLQSSGTLTFAVGETEKTVTLQLIGDTAIEANPREIFKVLYSNPVGAPLATPSTFVTIEDDDRTTIGPSGGVARIGGGAGAGAVTIHALAGALAADTEFSATGAADADQLIVGNAYTILPAATSFTARTTLAIAYPNLPQALPASGLVLARWDGAAWLPLPGSHVDATAQTVSAGISATGIYAVMDGRNKSQNIAYVVETPAAANEFTTVAAATVYVCTKPDKGRVIIRRSPITLGGFSPACAVSLEREDATPVTIDGATSVASASPISFIGFTFSGVAMFTAGSDLTLRNNQFVSTVDVFLDPSPPAAAPANGMAHMTAAAPAAGCSHEGNVDYRNNSSAGPLRLAVVGTAGYCGKTTISDSFMPAVSATATGAAKLTGEARLEVERLNIEDVTVTATAEGNARIFMGEVNTGRMVENLSIPAGISGPRLDTLNLNVSATAEVNLEGGGTLKFSDKGLRVRDEYRFSLLDNAFQGEVHGEIGASEVGRLSADIGGSATLNIADGVAIQGSASYRLNAGLRDGIVASSNASYSAGVSVDASQLPLNLPINLSVTGGSSTDVQGTVGVFGIGIGLPFGSPAAFAPAAAPATPAGLAINGFKIVSGSAGLAALKNGVHIDLEDRNDPVEIKNNTYSVGMANAIVVQNAKGTVLIQGNTITDANLGIGLENIPGHVTIDSNTITSNIGILPANGVQLTTITGNIINADLIGLNLNGTSSNGLRRTTASGNTITVPEGNMALALMSSTILNFHSNTVIGDIIVAAFGSTAYATVVGNNIQGVLADNTLVPVLTTDPGGQGLDPENGIFTLVDWTLNGCADYPPSLDQKDENDVCWGEVGLSPAVAPL